MSFLRISSRAWLQGACAIRSLSEARLLASLRICAYVAQSLGFVQALSSDPRLTSLRLYCECFRLAYPSLYDFSAGLAPGGLRDTESFEGAALGVPPASIPTPGSSVVFITGSAPGGLREPSDLGGATLGDIPLVLIHLLSGGVFLSGIRPSSTMLTKHMTARLYHRLWSRPNLRQLGILWNT